MQNAICSRINLKNSHHKISVQYNEAISDIINLPDVQKLDNYSQHLNTSRLQHSINVSFYSFRIARLMRINSRSTARAALLHDMYFYEFKNTDLSCKVHSSLHPELALENAKSLTEISSLEEDIILTHMWPMTNSAPSHLEGFVVTFVDKGCTVMEVMSQALKHSFKKFKKEKVNTTANVLTTSLVSQEA